MGEGMNSWKMFVKNNPSLHYEKNQDKFHQRIKNLISGDFHTLINQGGMGLGKTLATIGAMNISVNNYIATPFSQIKAEWSKELNRCKMNHAIWYSKGDCCIKKANDINFKMIKCNDSCVYRKHLEEDREYTYQCKFLTDTLNFPSRY